MKILVSKPKVFLKCFLIGLAAWLVLPAVCRCGAQPAPVTMTVDETSQSIRVDGHLGDWPVTRMILLNDKSQVTSGKINWKDKDHFSGRIFVTYDSQNFYL